MRPLDEALLHTVLATAEAPGGVRPLTVSFQGSSGWLADCERLVSKLPFVQPNADSEIVVTDEPGREGWRFALNGCPLSPDLREFFWHAAGGARPIELSLHSEKGAECRAWVPHYAGLHWRRDHAAAIGLAPTLLGLALAKRAGYALSLRPEPAELAAPQPAPGPLREALYKAGKAARSLVRRVVARKKPSSWRIAVHADAGDGLPASGWRWLRGFPGHQEADPFVARDGERVWLFYEDITAPSLRGRLAVVPALDAEPEPAVVLDAPYHLSYPCVFRHDGAWWMIPESEQNRTVDLYRATRFPNEWEKAATLIEGPALVDTTPLEHEGRWYFFTTALAPGRGLISLLFHADSLRAPWKLHPASPISLDAGLSRGAGPIQETGGRLVRPVQDCLEDYGYAMTLRVIEELTPTIFRERSLEKILPDWQEGLGATHTIGREGPILALDALR